MLTVRVMPMQWRRCAQERPQNTPKTASAAGRPAVPRDCKANPEPECAMRDVLGRWGRLGWAQFSDKVTGALLYIYKPVVWSVV